jgi:hypothetical protein
MTGKPLLAVVSFVVFTGTVSGQEKLKLPTGPPPQLLTIFSVSEQNAEINLTAVTARFIWESKQSEVQKDGKKTLVPEMVRKTIYETRGSTIMLGSAKFFDIDGNELNVIDIWKRAVPGTTVAVSTDGNVVDTTYRQALSKTTLLIVSQEFSVINVVQIAPGRVSEPGESPGVGNHY